MASVSRINGFRPVKHLSGGSMTGQVSAYFIPASDASVVMVGDLVKLLGDARSPVGVPTVTRVATAASDVPVGVVVGILFEGVGDVQNVPPVNDLNTPIYRRTLTDRYVLVADDPNIVMEAECVGTLGTADIGLNVAPTVTAGSTTSGASGMGIDLATKATTSTLPLKLVGFPNRPDNAIGDSFVKAYVTFNAHTFKSVGTTGT